MIRVLLLAVSMTIVYVAGMPNAYEFEMEEIEKVANFIQTKEDLIDFITEGQTVSKQQVKLTKFSYKDCGGASAIVNINSIGLSPDPLILPGSVNVTASFKSHSDIGSPPPVAGDLLLYKKIFGKFIKLPCIDKFGSCHYPDLCQLAEQISCPKEIVKIGINCRCPLKMNSYTLPNTTFKVSTGLLPHGDYRVVGNVKYMGKEAGCLDMVFTLD